jgi:hypothetical protein
MTKTVIHVIRLVANLEPYHEIRHITKLGTLKPIGELYGN